MEKRHCGEGSVSSSSYCDDAESENNSWYLDENMVHEIMQRMDARTLARSSCVCKAWRRAAADETLWESLCNSAAMASSSAARGGSLKSVVQALGGFRRLYVQCLRQLPVSSVVPAATEAALPGGPAYRHRPRPAPMWGRDEVHLSLSLFSIDCFKHSRMSSAAKTAVASLVAPTPAERPNPPPVSPFEKLEDSCKDPPNK